MKQRITRLTAEQRARASQWATSRIEAASCEATLMDRLRCGVLAVYRLMGVPAYRPPEIIVTSSPMAMVQTDVMIRLASGGAPVTGRKALDVTGVLYQISRRLYDRHVHLLSADVRAELREGLHRPIVEALDEGVCDAVRTRLMGLRAYDVGATLSAVLSATTHPQLRGVLSDSIRTTMQTTLESADIQQAVREAYGAWCMTPGGVVADAALYSYVVSELGVELSDKDYATLQDCAAAVHAISAYDGLAIVSTRPTRISWRPCVRSGSVGCALRSVEYSDGWTVECR